MRESSAPGLGALFAGPHCGRYICTCVCGGVCAACGMCGMCGMDQTEEEGRIVGNTS